MFSLLGSLWILRGKYWAGSRLKRSVLLSAFLLKVGAGCLYGLVYFNVYKTGDIVHYFQDSKVIYSALPQEPLHFLQMTFGYSPDGQVPDHLLYLDDQMRLNWRTQEYLSVRINSLLNLLSFGHFYGNIALLCIVSMIGLNWLHLSLCQAFPRHSAALALAVFFLPSTLFWCSAVHKDAITLFSLGAIIYGISALVRVPGFSDLFKVLLGMLLMWNSRSYLVLILLPNLFLYVYGLRHSGRHMLRFTLFNLLLLILLIPLGRGIPALDILGRLAFEQEFLLELKGNTHLDMRPIGDSLWSLLSNFPMALDHVWLKPFTHPPQNLFQGIAAIFGFLQMLLLLLLLSRWRFRRNYDPLLSFCLFFSLAMLLVVGLTVPALGAIVRYKSAVLPLVFAVALVGNDPRRWPAWLPSPNKLLKNEF